MDIKEQGLRAGRNDVSVLANPHTQEDLRTRWMEGYLEGSYQRYLARRSVAVRRAATPANIQA